MKILILCGTYPPDKCGVGDYTYKLYNSMLASRSNDDIYLLSSNEFLKNGDRISSSPLRWNFLGLKEILDTIRRVNPDIINFQFPTTPYRFSVAVLFLLMRLKQRGFRIVTTLHEYSYSPKLAQFRTGFVIKSSSRLIVVDEQYKIDIVDRKLSTADRILYLPIGSNIDRSTLSIEQVQLLRRPYIVEGGLLIGYFGFIFPAKGIETLIRLGQVLKQQNRVFKIVIAAELKSDDSYHQQILRLIETSGLDNELVITGYLPSDQIADLLKSMDVVVFPFVKGISTKNGSVLAALNQGVNVISTKSNRIQNFPSKLLHLVDHYTNVEQIIDIIDNHLVQDAKEEVVMAWNEIAKKTVDFLTDSPKQV